jgi:HEAT repeat protein
MPKLSPFRLIAHSDKGNPLIPSTHEVRILLNKISIFLSDDYYYAKNRIKRYGVSALGPLIEILQHAEPELGRALASAFGVIGPPAVESLLPFAYHSNTLIRSTSILALGFAYCDHSSTLIDPRVIECALVALEDNHTEVRDAAIFTSDTLVRTCNSERLVVLLSHLLQKAVHDQDTDVVRNTTRALGSTLKNDQESAALMLALEYDDPVVRKEAIKALARKGNVDALAMLVVIMQDVREGYESAARDATEALGSLKDMRAILPLLKACQQPSLSLVAQEALDQFGDTHHLMRRAVTNQFYSLEEKYEIVHTLCLLKRLGTVARYCIRLSKDRDPNVRASAQDVLEYCTLIRSAGQPSDGETTLLRASSATRPTTPPDELLRESKLDTATKTNEIPNTPLSRRIFGFLRRK